MAMTAPAGGHQAPPAYYERDLPPLPDLGDVPVASVQVSSGAAPPVPSKLPVEVTETVLQYSLQGNDSLSPHSDFSRDTPPEAGPSSPVYRHTHRPTAISKKHLTVSGKEPLSATLYLDPSLSSLIPINIPGTAALTSVADTALSTLQKYPDGTFNWTTGAPIGGMAGLAKQYVLPPDIKVTGENGNVWLRVGLVDERLGRGGVEEEEGKNKKGKGRSRGRVDVATNRGGVVVEVLEMDENRQIDLHIETGSGDVLVLLPERFRGPIRVNGDEPVVGRALKPLAEEVINPYEGLWTTVVRGREAIGTRSKKSKFGLGGGVTHGFLKAVAKFVPEDLRGQDDNLDMAAGGLEAAAKTSQSKILVKSEKGQVAFGLVGSSDLGLIEELELVVGEGKRGKRWWKSVL